MNDHFWLSDEQLKRTEPYIPLSRGVPHSNRFGGIMSPRRFELTDYEWSIIKPLLPQKSRGVARVDDRRVLNGILWRFRTGSPWADVPERYGSHTTCYNRFVRWRKAGIWDHLLDEISKGYDGDLIMIDGSCVRVHQHGATAKKGMKIINIISI